MFDVAPTELIVLGTVALLVIPPKDLPRAMRTAGYWVGRARGVARQFRSGFDSMLRDAELAEMEQRWKAENDRIMREHPATVAETSAAETAGDPVAGGASPVVVEQPAMTGRSEPDPDPVGAAEPSPMLSVEAPVVAAGEPGSRPAADAEASS